MRPTFGHFRRRPWEVKDIVCEMYVSPWDRIWYRIVFLYPLIRFALSHRMIRNTVPAGEVAIWIARPIKEWTLRSHVRWDWSTK